MERGGNAAAGGAKFLDGVDGGGQAEVEDEAWHPVSEFVHEPPVLEVTQPKGSFCQIDARFSVALDPEGVYNIITDPNNRRVFKNIKEVVFRKVLEDDGNRQLVEVDQLGRWRFLMLSGTFSSRVIVEQNRNEKSTIPCASLSAFEHTLERHLEEQHKDVENSLVTRAKVVEIIWISYAISKWKVVDHRQAKVKINSIFI